MGDSAEEQRRELAELQQQHRQDVREMEAKLTREMNLGKTYNDSLQDKKSEIEQLKNKMVRLTRQLDEEVAKRDHSMVENQMLERRIAEMGDPVFAGSGARAAGGMKKSASAAALRKAPPTMATQEASQLPTAESSQLLSLTSTKIMRVIDQWMRTRDMQQALLRGAGINDMAFSTLTQVLLECPGLQTLDLSNNSLTMDSCSDICQIITTCPSLGYMSLESNQFSLRSIGYFMTAIMERQSNGQLGTFNLLDIQGNEGLTCSETAAVPGDLMEQIASSSFIPPEAAPVVAHVLRALWRFLHDTKHPQVQNTNRDAVKMSVLDTDTIMTMETALAKILILTIDDDEAPDGSKTITADLALLCLLPKPEAEAEDLFLPPPQEEVAPRRGDGQGVQLPPISDPRGRESPLPVVKAQQRPQKADRLKDPLADLKAAFEPQREMFRTFNLKQIVTKSGSVYMNMLEKLLETTEIDARDVETGQTLLEYACNTGNVGLAKLCYRRGANLNLRTSKDDTAFNIVTRNRRYDIMEVLHTYGVKVNSADGEGRTALHVAAANNDIDAVCRLLEWGADVNILDCKRKTPLMTAASGGHTKVTMLLLEVGADMNATDDNEYTAVAHAEANNHFKLMDRLGLLGGKGHGLQKSGAVATRSGSDKVLGELKVSSQMLKSSSLGRISKVKVPGMPDHISKLGTSRLRSMPIA